jgi:hypothetical protein
MIKTWTEGREDKNGKPTMNNEARMKAEIAELREENKVLRDALEKLARLGNGEHYGNSDGNMIARAALQGEVK